MKKMLVAALVVALTVATVLPCMAAFAADKQGHDVIGEYAGTPHEPVYNVDIAWGGMHFVFNSTKVWDTVNHEWDIEGEEVWTIKEGSDNSINITNHSSVGIDIQLVATMDLDLGGEFKHDGVQIPDNSFSIAAPATGADGAISYIAKFMPTGKLPESYEGNPSKVGEITVVIKSNTPAVETFTVKFVDFDGTVLKEEKVEKGKSATAPADPRRDSYRFVKWDTDFTNVQRDLVVTATYEPIVEPTIYVQSVEAAAGDTVEVNVVVKNNPGIAGAILTMSFDERLTLKSATSGEVFADLTYTRPGRFVNPCNFSWDSESGMAMGDGTILTLVFEVSPNAAVGDRLEINCSYRDGDIYDENLEDVNFTMTSGSITLK